MTRKQLITCVQDLGRLRDQLAEIKTAERELTDTVRAGLEQAGLPRLDSAEYSACLHEQRSLVVDPLRLRRKVGEKMFMSCIRVDLAAARRQVAAVDLDKLGRYELSTQLRISRLPKKDD